MKRLLLIIFLPIIGFSQNGPAGIGNTQGNSSLIMWLNAETVQQDSGSQIRAWLDKSGFENHAKIEVGIGPIFLKNQINNCNSFKFTPSWTGILQIDRSEVLSPDYLSLFIVGKINKGTNPWAGFILKESGGEWKDGYGICINDDKNELIGYTSDYNDFGIKSSFNYGEYLTTSLHHNPELVEFFKNGSSQGRIQSKTPIKKNDNQLTIGWTGDYLDGEIAEIIMFNRAVSLVERRLIDNYLSTKYNLPIASADLYLNDSPKNGDFDFDMAGIGKAEDGSELLEASAGMVSINNPSDLNQNEYLLWAHNGALLTELNFKDFPEGVKSRLNREWRISEVDLNANEVDLGLVDITFDLTKLGKVDLSSIVLLLDENNDGLYKNERPLRNGEFIDGNKIRFNKVLGFKNNLRFTLATNNENEFELLPLVLSFNSKFKNDTILLTWECSDFKDVTYFLVQRSDDSIKFTTLKTILIDKEINQTKFKIKDGEPLKGYSFYRLLKITNGDTILVDEIGFDYFHSIKKYQLEENYRILIKLSEEKASKFKERYLYGGVSFIIIVLLSLFLKLRQIKSKALREKLIAEITLLKSGKERRTVLDIKQQSVLELDKEKIQLSINKKLNDSDWKILNIVFINPVIVNKEIAEKVNLSVEGTSSSLRKMYRLFNLGNSKNKKLALVMEAARISSNH